LGRVEISENVEIELNRAEPAETNWAELNRPKRTGPN